MSFLHSTNLPRGTWIPKSVNGRTRVDEKAARKAQDATAERECYRAVDRRDGLRSRVSGVRLVLSGDMTTRVHRHHMVKRSQKAGHDTRNIVTVSPAEHDEIHVKGTLRLSGDADLRDERGRLAGVLKERLTESGWQPAGMC